MLVTFLNLVIGNITNKKEIIFYKNYPKAKNGDECKKTTCERYDDYKTWRIGSNSLNFCINCKHAHVSQYKKG